MEKNKGKTPGRYPYTYAADYLREAVGYSEGSTILSRSNASQARAAIAMVLGMNDEALAEKLADAFLVKYPDE